MPLTCRFRSYRIVLPLLIASASARGQVESTQEDLAKPELVLQDSHMGTVSSVAFSPDGHTLASGSADGAVRLWDVTDLARPRPLGQPLTGSTAAVTKVVFSPGGHTLASGSTDGTVRLWDVTDSAHPRPLGQPLTGNTAAVTSVAFSPSGKTLASGSADGTTRLWNLSTQYAIQRICATAGGLTPRQWTHFIPQLQYQPSCGH